MIPRKHWIRAGTLIGGALVAAAALAQTPPATAPRDTTGDESATAQRECQQMTGVDRQNCMRRLQTQHEQTNPSTTSTTRSSPSSSIERTHPTPADQPRSQDQTTRQNETPGPSSSADRANSSTGRDAYKTDASGNRTRMSQKDTDTKDPNARLPANRPPADEEDESTTPARDQAPPPDTKSEADTQSDTSDPPQR